MMDRAWGPSWMLSALSVISSLDLSVVFVPSDRSLAGLKILQDAQEGRGPLMALMALMAGAGSPSGLWMCKSPSGESPVTPPETLDRCTSAF